MAAEVSSKYAVQMHGITKRFGSFYALTDVDLDVEKGTIHSILGENGAGKSTLMNVLYGLYQADEGEIYIGGKKVEIKNPTAAIEHGIGMVHQHFMLVENFTVTQNIVLGMEPTKSGITLNMKQARQNVLDIVEKYGLDVNPDALIRNITVGMQQRVEILKALYRGAEILILDEPTAVLTEQEIDELLTIMKNLIADGKTIIIITHKLKEIQASSDVCTIIRRGQYIDTVPVKDVTEDELAEMMVGRAVKLVVSKDPPKPGKVILDIQHLYVKNDQHLDAVKDFNLQVHAGEIVGIAGIDGNGQQELMEAVNNLKKCKGKIILDGLEIQNKNPKYGIDRGMATIPADRHKDGLVLGFSVYENTILEKYRTPEYSPNGTIDRKRMRSFAEELIRAYDVRPEDCGPKLAGGLSGGNQQKIIIGREIAQDPKLLIAIQPTRGLDVGAIENVHRMLIEERDRGVAVLLISFELDEVMNVSDRIAVMYDGHIQQIFKHGTVDNRTLGRVMAGGTVDESELIADPVTEPEPEPAPAVEEETTPEVEAVPAPVAEPELAPVVESESEPVAEPEPAPEEAAAPAEEVTAEPAAEEILPVEPEEIPEEPAPVRAAAAAEPVSADADTEKMKAEIESLHKSLEEMQNKLDEIMQKLQDVQ